MEKMMLGDMIALGVLKKGENVIYIPRATQAFTVPRARTGILISSENPYGDQLLKNEKLTWSYTGRIDKQGVKFVSDEPTSFEISLFGKTGFYNAKNILDDVANALFGDVLINAVAHSMTMEDYKRMPNSLKICKENPKPYYISDQKVYKNTYGEPIKHCMLLMKDGKLQEAELFNFGKADTVREQSCFASIRPVVYIPLNAEVSVVTSKISPPIISIKTPMV